MLVLTDGVPNCGPAVGALASLKNWKAKNGGVLPCTIYTFGFGYELESQLLRDLAAEGNGIYGFIPGVCLCTMGVTNTSVIFSLTCHLLL